MSTVRSGLGRRRGGRCAPPAGPPPRPIPRPGPSGAARQDRAAPRPPRSLRARWSPWRSQRRPSGGGRRRRRSGHVGLHHLTAPTGTGVGDRHRRDHRRSRRPRRDRRWRAPLEPAVALAGAEPPAPLDALVEVPPVPNRQALGVAEVPGRMAAEMSQGASARSTGTVKGSGRRVRRRRPAPGPAPRHRPCPGTTARTIAATWSAHGMSTALPAFTTTTVRGLAAATRRTARPARRRATGCAGRGLRSPRPRRCPRRGRPRRLARPPPRRRAMGSSPRGGWSPTRSPAIGYRAGRW